MAPCTHLPGPPHDLGCRIDDEVRGKKEPLLPRPRAKLHPRRVIISSGCSSGRHSANIPEGSSSACLSAAAVGQAALRLSGQQGQASLFGAFFFLFLNCSRMLHDLQLTSLTFQCLVQLCEVCLVNPQICNLEITNVVGSPLSPPAWSTPFCFLL